VPQPIDHARHCILMELIDAYPLRQISEHPNPGQLYSTLMDLIVRFAQAGLIHGDFNEFNILIRRETGEAVVIDFPQMVSTSHENAEWYFNRDVECIRTFFRRRFRYESVLYPRFKSTLSDGTGESEGFRLDVIVEASGFSKKDQTALQRYIEGLPDNETPGDVAPDEEEESEDSDSEGSDSESQASTSSQPEAPDEPSVPSSQLRSLALEESGVSPSSPTVPAAAGPDASEVPAPGDVSDGADDDDAADEVQQSGRTTRVKNIVASDVSRQQAKQKAKYHSGKAGRQMGRPRGSKAKADARVKIQDAVGWD